MDRWSEQRSRQDESSISRLRDSRHGHGRRAREEAMTLRSPSEYVESLRDGRRVYYHGKCVPDVTAHEVFRAAIEHASIDYQMTENPALKELTIVDGHSRYYHVPQDAADLLARSRLIEEATRLGRTLVVLIKEIGTDALFSLMASAERLGGPYPERVQSFYEHCRNNDLAVAVAQTDVKGDRSLSPSEQPNPDAYVRIVERRPDGIVVRGTKVHTSVSVNANEIVVLPTRQLASADAAYAVAFAIPVDTPGLTLIASPYLGARQHDVFEHPITSRHKMVETTTVFRDVFVPRERVFLDGEWAEAGPLARGFVEFHRFTAISYKLPLVDALVGSAIVMARLNGTSRASHVREKLAWLITYAETLRALTHHAAERFKTIEPGIAVPDTLLVNIAKLRFAQDLHTAFMHVQDIAGGLVVTSPSVEDFASLDYGEFLARAYEGTEGSNLERIRIAKLIAELTTGDFGGYQAVLAIHAEGSIEAEKLAILREYDPADVSRYVKWMAEPDD